MVSQVIASTHCYSLVSNEKRNDAMEPGQRRAQRERKSLEAREHTAQSTVTFVFLVAATTHLLLVFTTNTHCDGKSNVRRAHGMGKHSRTRRYRITLVVTRHDTNIRRHIHKTYTSSDLPSTTDGYQLINRRVEGKLFPLLLPHHRPLRPPTAYRDTTWSPLCSSFPSRSFSSGRAVVSSLSRSRTSDNQPLSSFVSFPSGLVGCARGMDGLFLYYVSARRRGEEESVRRDPLCIFTYTKTRFARGRSCGEFVAALRRARIKLLLQTRWTSLTRTGKPMLTFLFITCKFDRFITNAATAIPSRCIY